jgi:hypothetical protein
MKNFVASVVGVFENVLHLLIVMSLVVLSVALSMVQISYQRYQLGASVK